MQTGYSRLRRLLALGMLVCAGWAQASVVMMGTRVVYPGKAKEQTVQFQNPDAHPHVVQVWLDDGDAKATPDTAQSPFLALPQVFRIEPQTGQMVRLLMTDASSLPQDRESVFYLNFSQLPMQRKTDKPVNQLMIMFTSRLKVFYRPAGIEANLPQDISQRLQLTWRDGAVHVHNPTPYHVVVNFADLLTDKEPLRLASADMIAPFSDVAWRAPVASARNMQLRLVLVNDYGADVTAQLRIP